MLKALIKKQMLEVRSMYLQRKKKNGTAPVKRSKAGMVLLGILYVIMMGAIFALAFLIGEPLVEKNLTWIFFMIMNAMGFLLGVIGSVFTTAGTLFGAKDNEFLMAMPIPPSHILLSRMISVYIMSLIYSALVTIPSVIFYFIKGHPSVLAVVFSILGILIVALEVLTFSCFFGWIVALITAKLKNKSAITVIIAIIFIGAFILFRIRANAIFQSIAENSEKIGESVKGWGYPLYSLGLGMSGDILGFLAGLAIAAALFAITWLILSKSFGKTAGGGTENIRASFKDDQIRASGVDAALRRKEMKRFTSSPSYMLNSGLGALFVLAGAVFMLIKMKDIQAFVDMLNNQSSFFAALLPAGGAFAICLLMSMVGIAAPAISLEGDRVWILQTMPVDPYRIFKAKIYVHVVVTLIPAIICAAAMIIVLRLNALDSVGLVLCVLAFLLADAYAMLALDIKRPMMEWSNENQPIKQNMNVLFSWLGGMAAVLVLAGLYMLVGRFVGSGIYLIICAVIFAAFTLLMRRWMLRRGREIFATL